MTTDNSSEDMAYAYHGFMTDIDMNITDMNNFDLEGFDHLAGLNIYPDPNAAAAAAAAAHAAASQAPNQPSSIQYHHASLRIAPSLGPNVTSQPDEMNDQEFSQMQDVSSDFTQILQIAHPQTQGQIPPPRQYRFREQKPRKNRDATATTIQQQQQSQQQPPPQRQQRQMPTPHSSAESNAERRAERYMIPMAISPREGAGARATVGRDCGVPVAAVAGLPSVQQVSQRQSIAGLYSPVSSPVIANSRPITTPSSPPPHHFLGRKPIKKGARATPSPRLGVAGGGVASPSKRAGMGKRTMSAPTLGQKPPSSNEHSPESNQQSAHPITAFPSTISPPATPDGLITSVAPATPGSLMKIAVSSKSSHPSALLPTSAIPVMSMPSPSLKPLFSLNQQLIVPVNGNSFANAPPSPTNARPTASKSSPVALKPLISPQLKPLLPGVSSVEAAERLATKSNYQNILEGDTTSLGLSYSTDIHSGIELRRTSHKAAEQKRRDSLKRCFDELRMMVPNLTERNPSKVYLLQKSHSYIAALKTDNRYKDDRISALRREVRELKARLGVPLGTEDEEEPKMTTMKEDDETIGNHEKTSEEDDLEEDDIEDGESGEDGV